MSNTPFRVMRGEEISVLNKPFTEGQVYFATDTKRIYMDAYLNGQPQNKIPMGGGNSGIYYASKGFTDSSDVSFALADIEGDELPNVNDLIINYNSSNELRDGFYKVITVDATNNVVETAYLPVGGGGTGGSGSAGGGKILITPITPMTGITTSEKGYKIKYSLEAYNNAGAAVPNTGRATFIINGSSVDGGMVVHGNTYEFDVSQYLSSIKDMNTITLKVVIDTGGVVADVQTYTWTVKCVDLKVEWPWTYSSNNYITEDKFTLSWKITGGIECVTHISIDEGDELDKNYFTIELLPSQTEASKSFDRSGVESSGMPKLKEVLRHGSHKFTMWVTAKIGNEDIRSNEVNNVLTFIDADNTMPILTVPYFTETATQYDTLYIPFLVYKDETEKLDVGFYIDGIEVLKDEYLVAATSPHYWPYTVGKAGEIKLKIAFTKYPDIYYETKLEVIPLDLGIVEPTEGLAFSLKASDISGNAQLQQLQKDGKLTFSPNFDWVNGGLKSEVDEKGNVSNYICVRQGTTMTINYNLFGSRQVGTQGKTFKFAFKAMNCYDYNAKVLECKDPSTSQLFLNYTAQQAQFSSEAGPDFITQYCEGSYIELETEIWPDQADSGNRPGDRFLMFWVDGVPAGVKVFTNGSSFVHTNPQPIVIGSNECDVYVYIAKIYEKRLSTLEHLNNFILDAPNVNEKITRHSRNDILGSNNEISYEKLIAKNPGCHAYLYKLTKNGMTTGKEDEKDCDYTEYYLDTEKPYLTTNPTNDTNAPKAKVMVQGTSSAAYGVAAFNVRTDFADAPLYDKDGNQLSGRKVSDTSIPVDFTCTKVNVASCENANNALNAEWYDRFQPYYDGHRRQSTATKKYRDCMEFDFGVMFIEDHNENRNYKDANGKPDKALYTSANVFAYNTNGEEDRNYVSNPYYKQYAVANMGNDKKNRSVFHDTKNYNACCVEVLDNQNAEHWMTKQVTLDDFVWGDDDTGFYEFRYSVDKYKGDAPIPDGKTKEEYQQVQAQAFINFVNWMASCDPNPKSDNHPNGYTGAALPTPVSYGPKTFVGFNPPGYDDSTSSKVSLKGFQINTYAGEYTHDTFEYRMAKMLKECEDHLVMDSVVYHYLFIQRHTMVDNVAKNTFWSTEDLQHWDLTKNYDNDTSDGNDNSGYLKYTYGKEVMDKREDGADIFNASDSVWLNFIYNLPEVQEDLYKKLQNKKIDGIGVWDADAYLKLFKEKQSLIPERCWIEDYFRKYIRPRRLGLDGDNTFIQRLEGGKKTHQRQQYETYQSYYIDSKYCSGASFNDTGSFDMRLNKASNTVYKETTDTTVLEGKNYFELKTFTDTASGVEVTDYVKVEITDNSINPQAEGYYEITVGGWDSSVDFPVKYYIDLYPSAKIGGQIWRGPRTKRGAADIAIPVGSMLDAPTDATCYIYAANMLQSITGIADTYPNYMGISAASKLRELEAGSSEDGYFNDKLNNAVLDQNTQLEKAQLQQVGSNKLAGLDLSKLTMLKELKINMGSTFPSLKLAKGCIIDTLYLNPLTTLNVKELKSLTDFQYDNEIFDSLKSVLIWDCPTLNNFAYQIALEGNIESYSFNDIEWNVPFNDIQITTNNEKQSVKIAVLEKLLQLDSYVEVNSRALALTGKLIINIPADYTGEIINEFSVYENYKKLYPNLEIEFTGNLNKLKRASVITFYNDKDGDIIYQVKTDGTKQMRELTGDNSPAGSKLTENPTKESDKVYDYIWNKKWKDANTGTEYEYNTETFYNLQPEGDMQFYALYDNPFRQYTITLRDYNGVDIDKIENQIYDTNITNLIPYYMYRPHNTEGMRYEFKGWIGAKDYLGNVSNPTIITNFIVDGDSTYYAYYEEQNCITKHSRLDYFEFDAYGTTISLKPEYRYLIQEPITLPIKNGQYIITSIGSFGSKNENEFRPTKYTHIYFENNGEGGNYTTIKDDAFAHWSGTNLSTNADYSLLKAIYLPNTITTIGSYAFGGCQNLIELGDITNINKLGYGAFQKTGQIQFNLNSTKITTNDGIGSTSTFSEAGPGVIANSLPSTITKLGGYVFNGCKNVKIDNFTSLIEIGQYCFQNAGEGVSKIWGVTTNTDMIGNGAFNNYGTVNMDIEWNGTEAPSSTELNRIGLNRQSTTESVSQEV